MKQIPLTLLTALLLLLLPLTVGAQIGGVPREVARASASPSEMISMAPTMPFNNAVELLSILSRQRLGKSIVDPTETKTEIGIKIENLFWMDALDRILIAKGLKLTETKDYLVLKSAANSDDDGPPPPLPFELENREMLETREVVISALFFEANLNVLNEMGMSWGLAVGNGMNYQTTVADGRSGHFELSGTQKMDFGQLSVKLRALAGRSMGEIIANPQITVASGKEGRIQIGSDFSVTVKDYAGNALTQFFSTGSIVAVKPKIVTVDSTTFIQVNLEVQRSNANESPLGVEIKKTDAKTSVLLLDGEETIIGGLYSTETGYTREGVPFLKDLPWWVLGLRYIFGYETKVDIRKELVVLIKAELVPSLQDRVRARLTSEVDSSNGLTRTMNKMNSRMQDFQEQSGSREGQIK